MYAEGSSQREETQNTSTDSVVVFCSHKYLIGCFLYNFNRLLLDQTKTSFTGGAVSQDPAQAFIHHSFSLTSKMEHIEIEIIEIEIITSTNKS